MSTKTKPKADDVPTEKLTEPCKFQITPSLDARLRGLVDANAGPPHRLELSGFCRDAIEAAVAAFEKRHNAGKPYEAPK